VDINPGCKRLIDNDERLKGVHAITQDAIAFLETFDKKIDLLFLDAWDVEEGTPYAEQHLRAYLTCKKNLSDRCLILIDDTDVGGRGKGRVVIPKLIEDGFKCLTEGRQSLFFRMPSF
jgi:spermidine synthase